MQITTSLTLNDQGPQVAELHGHLIRLGYTIPDNEQNKDNPLFGIGTLNALRHFQRKYKLFSNGIYNERTLAAMVRAVAVAGSGKIRIEGRIFTMLAVYNRGVGSVEIKIHETETDGYESDVAAAPLLKIGGSHAT